MNNKKLLENKIRKIVKEVISESEFTKLNLDNNILKGLYQESRQVIQNMQNLQQDCKDNNITTEGVDAIINILERTIKRLKALKSH